MNYSYENFQKLTENKNSAWNVRHVLDMNSLNLRIFNVQIQFCCNFCKRLRSRFLAIIKLWKFCFFFSSPSRHRGEISARTQISRRIVRLLLGNNASFNIDTDLRYLCIGRKSTRCKNRFHEHGLVKYAHWTFERIPVGAERIDRSLGLG